MLYLFNISLSIYILQKPGGIIALLDEAWYALAFYVVIIVFSSIHMDELFNFIS